MSCPTTTTHHRAQHEWRTSNGSVWGNPPWLWIGSTGGMGYNSRPFKMVCYFDFFDDFMLNVRDFKRFSRV
jgi:hypothetical protein